MEWCEAEAAKNEAKRAEMKVTQELKNRGIRFLLRQEDSDEWIEPDIADVEKAVSQVFRNLRKKKKTE